jgi:hypothetical protein
MVIGEALARGIALELLQEAMGWWNATTDRA